MRPVTNPVGRFVIYALLIMFLLWSVVPILWITLQSFKTQRQAAARAPLFVFKPTLESYGRLWLDSSPDNLAVLLIGLMAVVVLVLLAVFARRLPIPRNIVYAGILGAVIVIIWGIPKIVDTAKFYDYFVNSLIVSAGAVIFSVSIGCLSGYALARYSGMSGVVILLVALAFRALPRMAFLLPFYWMGRISGLHDTYFLVIIALVAVNQPFTIWLLRSFFMDIPREIEDAAMIDGASRLGAFLKVITPIMWPGIFSTALFTLLLAYHEFLLVRILTQSKWTLPLAMVQYIGGAQMPGQIAMQAAAAVSSTIPIVLVILFFQKQLVKGLSAGAVKG
ncbi:MAG: carbohydrate ABC transporter permease [Chloroflexota bacterium]|nr:carbohydrate ABC transporter permease [Chloroflexota bacterium]MDE2855213.1 carbohydrate ABC transporter permease [Chloroflexota bacterium]MDE2947547.1 carbohydrate ABC transporter permease [Chloroflexota bacterium]